MYDLVVIGGGPGGYEAAAHAGRMGKGVALVEEKWLGGCCLNVGCIPAKAFLRSSRLYREISEATIYGVEVGAPRLDMPAVVERKDRIVASLVKGVEATLRRAGVELVHGRGRVTGRHCVEVGGRPLETANILLATGSRPAKPPISGIDGPAVVDSNSLFSLPDLPSRIAIIGGGYIGLEFATFFSEVGAEVVVFEMLPDVATGCDGEVSQRLLQLLRRAGANFKLSCRVTGIDGGTVHYVEEGGRQGTYVADRVLNATGRVPVVEDLGLEELGVDLSGRGVRTDLQGRTNVPSIWACGDVNGKHMLAHVATREGIVAVNTMFGNPDWVNYGSLPAVIYTHPEVAMAGRTEEELVSAGIPYKKATVPISVAGRSIIDDDKSPGFVKVLTGERYGEVLGAHAIGGYASEFIVSAATFIDANLTAERAGQVVFPHPTVSEALREALAQINQENSD